MSDAKIFAALKVHSATALAGIVLIGLAVEWADPMRGDTIVVGAVGAVLLGCIVWLAADAWRRGAAPVVQRKRGGNAASDHFAAITHELRTPLNGVMGVLHLLRRTELSAAADGLVAEALSSGAMMSALINDVLDFSKIDAGALSIQPQDTDLGEVLRSACALLALQCEEKGVTFNLSGDQDLGWAMIDELRLRQCLLNLIGNAVKFTSRGSVSVNAETNAGRLVVTVEDTGVGIPAQAVPTIFEQFAQADGAAHSYGGSGLGLAITRSLAELMGGSVSCESRAGRGSTFRLEITAPPVSARNAAVEAFEVRTTSLQVLIVDDNSTNRLVAAKLVEAMGCVAHVAGSGEQALSMLAVQSFDVVLMDVHMPEMNGLETLRRLRALPAGQDVPVIAVTGDTQDERLVRYRAAGMIAVVAKPLSPADLARGIGLALQGAQALSQRPSQRVN